MAALTSMSDLLNRMSGGNSGNPELLLYEKLPYFPGSLVFQTHVVHRWVSLWSYIGSPNAGDAPTAAAVPDSATLGALQFAQPGGGREKWITSVSFSLLGSFMGSLMIYDRLLHIRGLSGANNGPQTVGGTLTRNTGGVGNQIWYEIYANLGSTPQTITASYTNENGTAGRTTRAVTIGGSPFSALGNSPGTAMQLPLQDGDRGVQSVQSVLLNASTFGVGDFGIIIARPIMPNIQNIISRGSVDLTESVQGPVLIPTDACLAVMGRTMTTSPRRMSLGLVTVEA